MSDVEIDQLPMNSTVCLYFHGAGPYSDQVIFRGITGEGEERHAKFSYCDSPEAEWEAYRYENDWAYGSSAERLSVVEVISTVDKAVEVLRLVGYKILIHDEYEDLRLRAEGFDAIQDKALEVLAKIVKGPQRS